MILYELNCSREHNFSAWFSNSDVFEQQCVAGLVECPICCDTAVAKAPMSPRIGKAVAAQSPSPSALRAPDTHAMGEVTRMVGEFCRTVESNCDYVGGAFPEEARKIHYGESDARGIYGEASPTEAADLKEEGIEIAAVPWVKKADA